MEIYVLIHEKFFKTLFEIMKNEDMQEHTKRLRFKPLTNVQHFTDSDFDSNKNTKEMKNKGNAKLYLGVYFTGLNISFS